MLEIQLKRIEVETFIGIYDWEQKKKQTLYISVHLKLSSDQAIHSDQLAHSVDYEDIQTSIKTQLEKNRFALIEKIAGEVHTLLMKNKQIHSATVEVEKPNALEYSQSVSVRYSA
tara:strand:- start:33 stop:377 length:345 start_codon:yes stop_codon:yes gene_type:complete